VKRIASVVSILAGIAALAAGCSGETDTAASPATTVTTVAVSLDPCEPFATALAAGGYDTPRRRPDRTTPYPELSCGFAHDNPGYSAGIYVMGKPYEDVVADDRLVEREPRTVAGHDVSIGDASAVSDMCIISIDIPPGTLQIRVGYVPPPITQPDALTTIDQACAEAEKVLVIITPVLPDQL
jgi:hypothetical protein